MIEVLKQMYQLLLTEPHAPAVCDQLESMLRKAIAELESQEPKHHRHTWGKDGEGCVVCGDKDWMGTSCKPPAAQRTEQNFCLRCGKRTADLTTIHTCTPPQD